MKLHQSQVLALAVFVLSLVACVAPTSDPTPSPSPSPAPSSTPPATTEPSTPVLKGQVTTFAGASTSGYINAVGQNARFYDPLDLVAIGNKLYVTDSTNRRIRQIDLTTALVSTLAGSGANGYVDGNLLTAEFQLPYGIATDGTNLFVSEPLDNRIRRIDPAAGTVSTLADAASGSLNFPTGLASDGTSLFVCDSSNNQIKRIDIATGTVTVLAGSATGQSGTANGQGTSAQFTTPIAVATDGVNLYVADRGNHLIRRIVIATGVVSTLAGVTSTPGLVNAFGDTAQFNAPVGIAIAGPYLYVTELYNYTVRRVEIATGEVTTVAGTGVALTAGQNAQDGLGTSARFDRLGGITAVNGALYLVDSSPKPTNLIRKIE